MATVNITAPKTLDINDKSESRMCKSWKKTWERFEIATGIDDAGDKKRVCTLLSNIGESGSCYITELRAAADSCDFATITATEILRDRFVHGLRDAMMRDRLQRETNLTLDRAYMRWFKRPTLQQNKCM